MTIDTPGERAAREAEGSAAGTSDGIVLIDETARTGDVPNGRGRRGGQRQSMVASAARIDLNDKRSIEATKRRRQAWQTEAWDYYDEVGEIGYTLGFSSNLISKLRLYPAVRPNPDEAPIPVDSEGSGIDAGIADLAKATLARLRSAQGGQSAILRELALNFDVTGEAYLHGHEETPGSGGSITSTDVGDNGGLAVEDWQIRSVDELVAAGDTFALRVSPGAKEATPIPTTDIVIRLWERHPRFSALATCAMRRVLAEAESLLLLSREVRATSKCVDEETRIFTPDGWRSHLDLLPGDQVLTLDHITGLSRWEPVIAVNRYMRSAVPMMRINRRGHDSLTTLNHRWPVLSLRSGGRRRNWKTSATLSANDSLLCAAAYGDAPTEQKYVDALVEVVAWFWTEGYTRNGQAEITQSYEVNPGKVERIRQALTALYGPARPELQTGRVKTGGRRTPGTDRPAVPTVDREVQPGWRETTDPQKGCVVFRMNQAAAAPLLDVAPDRVVSADFVRSLTQAQLRLFIDMSLAADGTTDSRTGSRSITQNRPDRLDGFEMACILAGMRVTRSEMTPVRYPDGRCFPQWRLGIWAHNTAWAGPASRGRGRTGRRAGDTEGDLSGRTIEFYTGTVWCPTTPSETWLAERNGTVYWTGNSRLSNGLLLVPDELTFGPVDPTRDSGDGGETQDTFLADLQEAMILPVQNEGSASAVVPLTVRGPAEYLDKVRHLTLDRALDPVLEPRIEARIIRIARGLNMPVEVTTGMMNTTFANAEQIRESEFEDHIRPRAVLICDAITSGYFQWALEVAGVAADIARSIFVWYDPSDVIIEDDTTAQVESAHDKLLISDQAYRRRLGFTEEDRPDDAEVLRRMMLNSPRMDPFMLAQLLKQSGLFTDVMIPAPPVGVYGDTSPVSAMPAVAPAAGAVPASPTAPAITAAAAAAGGWAKLGATLTGIDRGLRERILAAADQAMRAALDRAGNKIKARVQRTTGGSISTQRRIADAVPARLVAQTVGPDTLARNGITEASLVEGAFDSLLTDIKTWMDVAFVRAVKAVADVAGTSPGALEEARQAHQHNSAAAIEWIRGNLIALAGTRLYDPNPAGPNTGEHDPTVLIPASMVRAAVAVAGGAAPKGGTIAGGVTAGGTWVSLAAGPVTAHDGSPLGGIGTGPTLMGLVTGGGGQVSGYEWDYGGGARSEFKPHLDLSGTTVEHTDDDKWANPADFPPTDHLFPGDHEGCLPGEMTVSGPAATSATLRDWQGEMVRIRTASGQFLAATPNHPVLTTGGWVPIGGLSEGDEVIRCLDGERITELVPNGYQMPACIKEVADTVGVGGDLATARVKVAPEDFHGDGTGSKVAVVRTDRDLRDRVDAALGQPTGQPNLPGAHPVGRVGLPSQSAPASGVETVGLAPFGVMGGGGHDGPPFGGPRGVHEAHRFATAADLDAFAQQLGGDRSAGSGKPGGESFDGLAGLVAADKVLTVERYAFSGHVYNLATRVGWYIAEGIITHNCGCDITPVIIGPDATTSTPEQDQIMSGVADQATGGGLADGDPLAEFGGIAPDDTYVPAQAAPGKLADHLGYGRATVDGPPTPEDLAQAKAALPDIKAGIREQAQAIADDHQARLEIIGLGRGNIEFQTTHADWFEALASNERARLRTRWLAPKGDTLAQSVDEAGPKIAETFGLGNIDSDQAIRTWVQETRIIDAATDLSRYGLVRDNAAAYGGMDLNNLIDSQFDLKALFSHQATAVEHVAEVNRQWEADEAEQILGHPNGIAPWQMTEAEYVTETAQVEAQVGAAAPEASDAFGDTYSAADEKAFGRLQELLPDVFNDPGASLDEIYRAMLKTARAGGLL
jgi:hypothetical protein